MTPLQQWFAFETNLLVPAPDECQERFEPSIAELIDRLPCPNSMASAMYRKQRLGRLFGMAQYYAKLEAARLNKPVQECFIDLNVWAAQDYCSAFVRPLTPVVGQNVICQDPASEGLSCEQAARFHARVRESVLQEDDPSRMLETTMACEPEHLTVFLQRFGKRFVETRRQGRTTQVWEFDEYANVLWFVVVHHEVAKPSNNVLSLCVGWTPRVE